MQKSIKVNTKDYWLGATIINFFKLISTPTRTTKTKRKPTKKRYISKKKYANISKKKWGSGYNYWKGTSLFDLELYGKQKTRRVVLEKSGNAVVTDYVAVWSKADEEYKKNWL